MPEGLAGVKDMRLKLRFWPCTAGVSRCDWSGRRTAQSSETVLGPSRESHWIRRKLR